MNVGRTSSLADKLVVAGALAVAGGASAMGSAGLFAAEAGEGCCGEDDFDRHFEVLSDLQSEMKARAVLASFEVADGLIVDANGFAQLPSGDSAFGADHSDPIVDLVAHRTHWAA